MAPTQGTILHVPAFGDMPLEARARYACRSLKCSFIVGYCILDSLHNVNWEFGGEVLVTKFSRHYASSRAGGIQTVLLARITPEEFFNNHRTRKNHTILQSNFR